MQGGPSGGLRPSNFPCTHPRAFGNLHTASVITVTGMYINDDVYHREEGDQKGAIARFVSLTGRVFLVSPDSSWVILSSDMKETACGDIQGHTDDKECTLEVGVAKLSYLSLIHI